MKKFLFLLAGIFLYAGISNALMEIVKIENFKPRFKKIFLPACTLKGKKTVLNNTVSNLNLKLEAIFNKKALINHKWVRAGNSVKGYKIIKVFPKKVILKKNNKYVVLKFESNILKVKK
ncbi:MULTISPECIES: hypothetical protein [unclassified Lebetimonas]|uniref:hypothetical protein n=1 Tax=unclassified Lebetimonas TaxID=2648158 RepID=UPI000466E848|nr:MULTISPECIES: hypothetical protein [unclassified Lebetimonas]